MSITWTRPAHAHLFEPHVGIARQIAIAFPVTVGMHQEMVLGIMQYAQEQGPWTFLCGSETLTMSVISLKDWPGDGVIANVVTKGEARAAAQLGLPVVNLSGVLADAGLPRVMNDQRAIGRLAAEHLLECEFYHFAYYGITNAWYSQERCRGFSDRIAKAGYSCAVLETAATDANQGGWRHWQERLRRWMSSFQRPLAVMAVNDVLARMVVDTCRQLGLHVPHDVAVVGVGNNALICEGSQPTLTSVARNGREIGYRAAQLLNRLMTGKRPPRRDVVLPPAGVVARQSTDVVALDDSDLSLAVRYIHDHLNRPFSVSDLARDMTVSRRWLEYRFRERLGRSPYDYICEARVEHVKQLIVGSRRIETETLARECGFSRVRTLQRVFQRLTGMTPTQYRRRFVTDCPRQRTNQH